MKICVLSDVHGNDVALRQVIKECDTLNIDKYIFLGDLLIKGPSPKECYDLMIKMNPMCWIKGNTDEAFEMADQWETMVKDNQLLSYLEFPISKLKTESVDLLLSMNIKESITIEGVKILCTHGSPRDVAENVYPYLSDEELAEIIEDVDEKLILCGHTHYPMIRTYKDKVIFNPGSISFPVGDAGLTSYGILEIKDEIFSCTLKTLHYNKDEAIEKGRLHNMPNLDDFVELIK